MAKLFISNRYGQVPNELLNRKDISLKAKGMFAYLQAKPDGWEFSVERMEEQTKDGRDSITVAIKELETIGYLKRKPVKDSGGKWDGYDYTLTEKPEKPLTDKPLAEKPLTVKPLTENPQPLVRKSTVIKNTVIKMDNTCKTEVLPVNQFINLFKGINPLYASLYKNRTERKSSESLLKIYPLETWERFFSEAPRFMAIPYCPTFSKPTELENKFSRVIMFLKQNQVKEASQFKIF